jgi:glycosyltransferase involved in cell wall biosynthesis
MLGLRGLPNVQGGVEKHVEQLALQLLKSQWTVDVIGRTPYLKQTRDYSWKGIHVLPSWAPTAPGLEAIVHTFLGVFQAARLRPDILHIHAIGPSLLVPLARLLGLNVVVTHHGFDYNREKWGFFGRMALHVGEYFGMSFANGRIAISQSVADTMERQYAVPVRYIPNGVSVDCDGPDTNVLETFGLGRKRYIIMVSRIVPEKRQLDLIAAFGRLAPPDMKLVIVGNADNGSAYLEKVRAAAESTPNVVCTGVQTGDNLATLYRNAGLFVLPSSHEGMPIVVLEALAYGLPVLTSNIPANLALKMPSDNYFPVGDIDALSRAIAAKLSTDVAVQLDAASEAIHSWSDVCEQTLDIYWEVLEGKNPGTYPAIPRKYGPTGPSKSAG